MFEIQQIITGPEGKENLLEQASVTILYEDFTVLR